MHSISYMARVMILFAIISIVKKSTAQIPDPALIGYFHNWNDASAPYIPLDQVDSRYNVIDVAFAVPTAGTDYQMEFIPAQVSQSVFTSQIQTLQAQGRKVLISIGGATAPVSLDNISERDSFVASMNDILQVYGFDGIDIDLEGASISVTGGTIANPVDQPLLNLIYAIKQIMSDYYSANNRKLILTMAPEAAYVQGGQSAYGGIWGAYLPVIDALRDSLDLLHVQLYNTGSMYGIDGNTYTQGTADFIVAMTEAVIVGFNTGGGMFNGLPAEKVAIGLPACALAAGGGFTDTATVKSAVDYLRGTGPKPGSYSLLDSSGYAVRGLMTWSINWDVSLNCNSLYEFAENFENIFSVNTDIASLENNNQSFLILPNPASDYIRINKENNVLLNIYNSLGELVLSKGITEANRTIDVSGFNPGIYVIKAGNTFQKLIVRH